MESPLTGSPRVVVERSIPSDLLIQRYDKELDLDVRRFFDGVPVIELCRCLDTGYRFYRPDHTSGDAAFYESLQRHAWYYMDWKWEHEVGKSEIRTSDTVLEIGAGPGEFLRRLRDGGISCVGLELNAVAASQGMTKGLDIRCETIEQHLEQNEASYDVVCAFQVVEHMADAAGFLRACVRALKRGGRLIVSVPNGASFLFTDLEDNILNMPPHHMGIWDAISLIRVQKLLGLELRTLRPEPLQPYHRGYARQLVERSAPMGGGGNPSRIRRALLAHAERIARPYVARAIAALSDRLVGHTVVACYVKE